MLRARQLNTKVAGGRLWVIRDGPSSLLQMPSDRSLAEIKTGRYWITPLPFATEREFLERLDVPYWPPPA